MPWRLMGDWSISPQFSWPRHYIEVVSFMPRPLYPRGKNSRYPLDKEVGWAPEPVWMLWRREKSFPCRESNPGYPARSYPDSSRYIGPPLIRNVSWLISNAALRKLSHLCFWPQLVGVFVTHFPFGRVTLSICPTHFSWVVVSSLVRQRSP
jgi:hypothetical protein